MSVDAEARSDNKFLGLAVHEILTPVTVVNGYLTMLLKGQAGAIPERQRHMLQEAQRSCNRLAQLAEELRIVRKLDSGDTPIERADVDIAALLAELASGMHEGDDRGVRFDVRGTDRPVIVVGDRPRLAESLMTLMHVAVRERGEAGAIVAHCEKAEAEGYAIVAFADESMLPQLIRPGAADSLAFDEYRGGTGFRLPLARRIIELHGGTIWSAATSEELEALDLHKSQPNTLSYTERGELLRKRATAALRLPLRT